MALTRKMLQAMGIEAEKIDQIIEAHTETTTGLKEELTKAEQAKNDLQSVTKERDGFKKQVDELTKASGDVATVKKEFDDYKATVEGEKSNKAKLNAVIAALNEKGIVKAAAVLAKTIDLSALTVEGEKVAGVNELITPLVTENAWAVETTETHGVPPVTPPSGNPKTYTREEISKMTTEDINKNWDAVKKVLETPS